MSYLRSLAPMSALALSLLGSSPRAQEQPQLVPTRDVDITYKITRPHQPTVIERVRWSAGEHLERVAVLLEPVEQRRDQESTAHPDQAREKPDQSAVEQNQADIDVHMCNRQEKFHEGARG